MPYYKVTWPNRGGGNHRGSAYMHTKHPIGRTYLNPSTPSQAARKAANAAKRQSSSNA